MCNEKEEEVDLKVVKASDWEKEGTERNGHKVIRQSNVQLRFCQHI